MKSGFDPTKKMKGRGIIPEPMSPAVMGWLALSSQMLAFVVLPFGASKIKNTTSSQLSCGISTVLQLGVHWVLALLAWRDADFNFQWLEAPSYESPSSGLYETMLFQIFAFQLLKDIKDFWQTSILVVHHVLCLFGIGVFYSMPCGFGLICIGVACLEFGSGVLNLELLWPGRYTRAYLIVMSTTTFLSLLFLPLWLYYAFRANAHWGLISFITISHTTLNVFRQFECLQHCNRIERDKREASNKEH